MIFRTSKFEKNELLEANREKQTRAICKPDKNDISPPPGLSGPSPVNFSPLTFLSVPSSTNIGETTGKNISSPDLTHEPPSLMAAKADALAAAVGWSTAWKFCDGLINRCFASLCLSVPSLRSYERSFYWKASISVRRAAFFRIETFQPLVQRARTGSSSNLRAILPKCSGWL